jgi:hypothetical protein
VLKKAPKFMEKKELNEIAELALDNYRRQDFLNQIFSRC